MSNIKKKQIGLDDTGTHKDSKLKRKIAARKESRKLFDMGFTEFDIVTPDGSIIEIDLKRLIINENVPEDILGKLGRCPVYYARFAKVKADMESYLNLLEEDLDTFFKKLKAKARPKLVGNASEAKVEEKALYSVDAKEDLKKHKAKKSKIRVTKKYLEQLKRTMYSFEILVDSARSIISYAKKDWEMVENMSPVVRQGGSLKTKKN